MGLGSVDAYAPGYPPSLQTTGYLVCWYPHRDAPELLAGWPYRRQGPDSLIYPNVELGRGHWLPSQRYAPSAKKPAAP